MATTEQEYTRGNGRRDVERAETREVQRFERPEQRRPIGSLLRELTREASALVRGELILAKGEIREDVDRLQKGASAAATGGAVLHAGVLALVAAAILALALVWPAWLAALVVGAAVAVIGAVLVGSAKSKVKPEKLKPERSMESLERDRTFAGDERERAKERMR